MNPGFQDLFPTRGVLIGVIHLPALPGAPRAELSMAQIEDRARAEARLLAEAGFDGIIVENFGDAPFFPSQVPAVTVAAMTRAVVAVKGGVSDGGGRCRLGVNVLRNDASAALAIAAVTGADFIRVNVHCGTFVTDQGLVEGRAYETLRERRSLGCEVAIFADVMVKHARPLGDWDGPHLAEDTWHRGGAQALIVTGEGTGKATSPERLLSIRSAVPAAPVLVGSGATLETLPALLALCDGVIVGTALKYDGKVESTHDPRRLADFVAARDRLRAGAST